MISPARLRLLQLLALVGIGVCGYLFYAKLTSQFFCPIGDCAKVNDSSFAYVGPVPVSLLGATYYVFLLALLQFVKEKGNWVLRWMLGVSLLIGLLYSTFLTVVEVVVIEVVCMWCVVSFLLVVAMNAVGFVRIKEKADQLDVRR